jgi:hypothetical protein
MLRIMLSFLIELSEWMETAQQIAVSHTPTP